MLLGSHSDSQPEGGCLNGAYGVIAALEVARAALEAGGRLVAVVSFQDEEGRFGPLVGSKVWPGALSLAEAYKQTDTAGVTFAGAQMKIAGLCQPGFASPDRYYGFIEAHIEQGIVLESAAQSLGVVDSIVGIRSEIYCFRGQQNHAGTTPMDLRRAPVSSTMTSSQLLRPGFRAILILCAPPQVVFRYDPARLGGCLSG